MLSKSFSMARAVWAIGFDMGDRVRNTTINWDPFDEDIDTNPYEIWRALRDDAPVYYNERYDFWALSRYADVEFAHRQPLVYSSAHGTVLELMSPTPMQTGMMIFKDPPDHSHLRSLVSRAFTPRRVAELEPSIREYCRTMLQAWEPGTPFDYVQQFGALLPAMVIAELLSVPESDRTEIRTTIDTAFHIEPGVGMINDISIMAFAKLYEYLTALVTERAANPGDDLISALTLAEIDGDAGPRRLTVAEATEFTVLLISAGTETVGKLLGWGTLLLGEHPEQQQFLRSHPEAVPHGIEEMLRYEAPSPVQGRWATEDLTLHDVTIPAGSKVLLLTGSAGRDERKYDDADRFDVERQFDHHVAFGFGVHFCLGAALARLEGRVAIEETLAHTSEFTSDRSTSIPVHTSTVRGWKSVSLTSS
jgi:cytochrome P450